MRLKDIPCFVVLGMWTGFQSGLLAIEEGTVSEQDEAKRAAVELDSRRRAGHDAQLPPHLVVPQDVDMHRPVFDRRMCRPARYDCERALSVMAAVDAEDT